MRWVSKGLLGCMVASSLFSLGGLTACSQEEEVKPSGLMLAMRTDMRVPEFVDAVGVFILQSKGSGVERQVFAQVVKARPSEEIGVKSVSLPAQLGVQSSGDANERVRVKVAAYDVAGNPLVLREARVSMPQGRVALLPLPLLWLNSHEAAGDNIRSVLDGEIASQSLLPQQSASLSTSLHTPLCGDEQTLDERGECVQIDLDESALSDYQGPTIPPEASASAEAYASINDPDTLPQCTARLPRHCYDVYRCLGQEHTLEVDVPTDPSACHIEKADVVAELVGTGHQWDGNMRHFSVAMMLDPSEPGADQGVCEDPYGNGPGQICVVPLRAPAEVRLEGEKLLLPAALCRQSKRKEAETSQKLQLKMGIYCRPVQADERICNLSIKEHSCVDWAPGGGSSSGEGGSSGGSSSGEGGSSGGSSGGEGSSSGGSSSGDPSSSSGGSSSGESGSSSSSTSGTGDPPSSNSEIIRGQQKGFAGFRGPIIRL